MLVIDNLSMGFGSRILFTEVSLNLNPGKRYGLVGANGAGKSTFLKVVLGDEEPSFGVINTKKGSRIGAMKQDQYLYDNEQIILTVIAGKEELYKAMKQKEELLSKDSLTDDEGMMLAEMEHVIIDNDGYTAEIEAAKILEGLGIGEDKYYLPMSSLSGGYKLRVLLAQSLFNNPDILLLDEPTNHLDIQTIFWLEQYLIDNYKGILIFISHDVSFLNNLSTHILDVDYGEVRAYTGNYDKFIEQKIEVEDQKKKEASSIQKTVDKLQIIADKFRAGTRSRQSKSIEKRIDKIELPDLLKSSRIAPNFAFNQSRNSGKLVLKADKISKSFNDKNILNKISFDLMRGERLLVMGQNGIGKSTLLKILMGKLPQSDGAYEWGHETKISYFAQDHHEEINDKCSIIDWLQDRFPHETNQSLRACLGRVLFSSDEVNKNVNSVSGGEAARLLIAKIMLEKSSVLVLDEPTNHMDIETKDALANALNAFEGSIVFVSHDRDFSRKIANRVLAMSKEKFIDYKGNYNEFISKFGMDYLNNEWVLDKS